MGYTHYFEQQQECPPEWWSDLCDKVRQLQATALLQGTPLLVEGLEDDGHAIDIDDEHIAFNGIPGETCETFWVTRHPEGPVPHFNFCKTRQRGYDPAVTAVLCLMHHCAPGIWAISSDGAIIDWIPGLTLARQVQPECSLPFES